jgi:beta-lactamase class A
VRRVIVPVSLLAALALVPSGSGAAPTVGLLLGQLTRVDSLAVDARGRDPEAVQARYDAARELQGLLAGRTVRVSCQPLLEAIARAAAAHVLAAEGVDRLDRRVERRGEEAARSAGAVVRSERSACPPATRLTRAPSSDEEPLVRPLDGEAFFGSVRARRPSGGTGVELRWNGRLVSRLSEVSSSAVELSLTGRVRAGPGDVELRFLDRSGAVVTTAGAADVWLLPANGRARVAPERRDRVLSDRLARLASGFSGYEAVYVRELATGRTGSWNEDARFPAASLVKLGVLAAAIDRFGPRPERAPAFHDVQAIAAWSSNLGANRLLELLGSGSELTGRRVVESRMRRMGATRSTYPGDYRVGTSLAASAAAPSEPPLVSQRVTTARDMTDVLASLHSAATGSSRARQASGLTPHEARVALALLLSSEPRGENLGLFRPSLPTAIPAAQKHGWISSARHSAAIVYGPRGPVVVVVLTYREGLSLARARELARRVLAASGL